MSTDRWLAYYMYWQHIIYVYAFVIYAHNGNIKEKLQIAILDRKVQWVTMIYCLDENASEKYDYRNHI